LAVHVVLGNEVFDLGGNAGGEGAGLEAGHTTDAARAQDELLPRLRGRVAQRRHHSHAGHDHAAVPVPTCTHALRTFLVWRPCRAPVAPGAAALAPPKPPVLHSLRDSRVPPRTVSAGYWEWLRR